MVLPTIQREDGAKGVPGQSVTLSQFPALSAPKRALVLTLAPSEVSNDRDDTFQHAPLTFHLLRKVEDETFLSLFGINANIRSVTVALARRVNTDKVCRLVIEPRATRGLLYEFKVDNHRPGASVLNQSLYV